MTKIISAQSILKEKGYVQNKFDTKGFMLDVAGMFGELPVEGKVTLQCVRMLDIKDDSYPLTEKERRQGYFFRDEGESEDITAQCAQFNERLQQIARERERHERLEGGRRDELAARACKLVSALHQRLYREYAHSPMRIPFGEFEESETGYLTLCEECPPQLVTFLEDISWHVKETTCTTVRVTPVLLHVLLREDGMDDTAIAEACATWHEVSRLRDEGRDIRRQIRELRELRDQRRNVLPPYTVYIDRPFFGNAASMLQIMGGYVVEKTRKKNRKIYEVTLI